MFVRWTDDRKRKILEFATTLNIGAGGVLLAMYRRAPVGTNLSIEIPSAVIASEIPLSGSVTHLQAQVLRVDSRDKAHFIAATFTTPLEDKRAMRPAPRSQPTLTG
jgi:hypothetical protein